MATTLIDAVCAPALLDEMIAGGYVRVQRHPTVPLSIYNYTEKAQFENVWNDVTLTCRGLIVDDATRTVVARPFAKFFNHGQPGAPALGLDEPVSVTDKADGSLGVLYPVDGGLAIATRGSFDSDQARHATELWRTRYADRFMPPAGLTLLFEIVYPGNRIVIDYGALDDLILLGAVDVATGRSFGPAAVSGWPGPVVESFAYATLAEALAAPPRDNREGLVVHFTGSDLRVKIKYEEYVRLHRLVTGLNARVVWECMVTGTSLDDLIAPLPDEFHGWVRRVATDLAAEVEAIAVVVEAAYRSIVDDLPAGWTRKDFALIAARHPERACLFLRLDERDYRPLLWQRVRPTADAPMLVEV
jgi:RNA ligase